MEKKIRALFEKERQMDCPRNPNHEEEFIARLYEELPERKRGFSPILKIAASIVLLIGMGIFYYTSLGPVSPVPSGNPETFSLGQLSPDLKEVENYYSSNIQTLLTNIEHHREGTAEKERYLNRLSILQKEHETIVSEIKEDGPSTFTVSALINNLRLQLELLQELNHEITSSKNENYGTI